MKKDSEVVENNMDIFILLLACAGLTVNIVHAEIFDMLYLRPLWNKWSFTKKLFGCSLCTGFHVGWSIGLVYIPIWWVIPFAFASSGFCFLFERLVIMIDNVILKQEGSTKKLINNLPRRKRVL